MWGDQSKSHGEATQSLMMVDTVTAIILLIKKWVDAHSLTMKENAAKYISEPNGTAVLVVGITSISLLLVPTMEADMANAIVCLGYIYQGLLGCNLLCRYNEALRAG